MKMGFVATELGGKSSNEPISGVQLSNGAQDSHDDDEEQHSHVHFKSTTTGAPPNTHQDSHDEEQHSHTDFNLLDEARLLLNIAIPTIAVQFSIYFIYPQTAAKVGRDVGTEELAGFSLASLTGNLTCLSVIMGVLSASDTLQPRAFGTADYREVASLTVRGITACAVVLLPLIIPLVLFSEDILVGLGQDEDSSELASHWIRVYLIGIPSVILFRVIQRFLACQSIVAPMVYAAAIGCFVIHPFILRMFVTSFGFIGSSAAIVTTQTLQAVFVLSYLRIARPYDPRTWPGLSFSFIKHSLSRKNLRAYFRLSLGGVLSFSEWWYWEIICFTAGRMGIVQFCAHTIAYNLIPTLFMIPLGTSVGLTVRLGNVLAHDVEKAKRIAKATMGASAVLAALIALLVYTLEQWIVSLFTTDVEVAQECSRIWPLLSVYIFILNIFGINSGIIRALGLQLKMAMTIFILLWCCALPTVYVFSVKNGGELPSMWGINCIFYTLLNGALVGLYATADWKEISDGIQRKTKNSIVEGKVPDEETYLLNEGKRQMRTVDLYE